MLLNLELEMRYIYVHNMQPCMCILPCVYMYMNARHISDVIFYLRCLHCCSTVCSVSQNNDKAGVSLHNGMWAPLFLRGAGTCM